MLPRDILFVISNYTCGSRLYHKKQFNNVLVKLREKYFENKRISYNHGKFNTTKLSQEEIEYRHDKGEKNFIHSYTYPISSYIYIETQGKNELL